MTTATRLLVERFERALGPPVCTPDWIMGDRGLERARYRVFRWVCPVCEAGYDDPLGLYRPLVIDSDGRVGCDASGCPLEEIAAEVRTQLDAAILLDSIKAAI